MKRNNAILKIISCIFILLVSLRYIMKIYQPTLLDDEFAYFGIAKYFTGTDWSGVISNSKYYSYGYSILILPFAFIIKNSVSLYRVVVSMNGLFLVGSFLTLDSIFCNIFEAKIAQNKISKNTITMVSLLMILIPCNMNYALVALPECLLLNIFLVLVRLIQNISKDTSCIKLIGIGCLSMYMYSVHQRTLGIVIALIIVLIIKLVRKELNISGLIGFFITVIGLYIVHSFTKSYILNNVWENGYLSTNNDMGEISGNIKEIFTSFRGCYNFIISMWGKIYYLASSTYLFELLGIFLIVRSIIKSIKEKKVFDGPMFFILLSFVNILMLSSVFMNEPKNMSFMLYGRYLETFMPIITGYGVIMIISKYEKLKFYSISLLGCGGLYGLIGILIRSYVKKNNVTWLNYISTGQLYKYLIGEAVPILRIMLVVIITCTAIFLVLNINKYKAIGLSALGIFVFTMFYNTAYVPFNKINLPLQKERYDASCITEDIEEYLRENQVENIVYVIGNNEELDSAQISRYLQYWLGEVKIEVVLQKDLHVKKIVVPDTLLITSMDEQDEIETFSYLEAHGLKERLISDYEIFKLFEM